MWKEGKKTSNIRLIGSYAGLALCAFAVIGLVFPESIAYMSAAYPDFCNSNLLFLRQSGPCYSQVAVLTQNTQLCSKQYGDSECVQRAISAGAKCAAVQEYHSSPSWCLFAPLPGDIVQCEKIADDDYRGIGEDDRALCIVSNVAMNGNKSRCDLLSDPRYSRLCDSARNTFENVCGKTDPFDMCHKVVCGKSDGIYNYLQDCIAIYNQDKTLCDPNSYPRCSTSIDIYGGNMSACEGRNQSMKDACFVSMLRRATTYGNAVKSSAYGWGTEFAYFFNHRSSLTVEGMCGKLSSADDRGRCKQIGAMLAEVCGSESYERNDCLQLCAHGMSDIGGLYYPIFNTCIANYSGSSYN